MAPNALAEGSPDPGSELGSTVRDDVLRDTVQPDHVLDQQVRRLSRGKEFGQGDEVHHLREPVDQGQDGVVAPGGRKASDQIEGNI